MKNYLKVLLVITSFIIFSGQTTVNHHTFGRINDFRVNHLKYSMSPRKGVSRMSYVSGVGGIAFEAVAAPSVENSLDPKKLEYRTSGQEGERLVMTLSDGSEVKIPIHDWELKPIALYADTEYYSCFSLFGTTGDKETDKSYMDTYNLRHLASYHSEFEDTLVGLRLMQMDSFYMLNFFSDLPTETSFWGREKIILGQGETASKKGNNNFLEITDAVNQIEKILQSEKYTAYVIMDDPSGVSFSVEKGKLALTGHLYIHFWKSEMINLGRLKSELLKRVKDHFAGSSFQITESDVIAARDRIVGEILAEDQDTYQKPVHVASISKTIYKNNDLLQKVNPLAYNTTVHVMRYSAFFRYIKNNFPEIWNQFLNSKEFQEIKVKPSILTPNVFYKEGFAPEKKDNSSLYFIIGGILFLLVAIGGIVFFIIRKKKN